jgi:hypothetical protein
MCGMPECVWIGDITSSIIMHLPMLVCHQKWVKEKYPAPIHERGAKAVVQASVLDPVRGTKPVQAPR